MRSSREWVEGVFDGANLTPESRFDFNAKSLEDLIESVKQEAFKEAHYMGRICGLRDAAAVIQTRKSELKNEAYNCAVEECLVFVRAETERLACALAKD